MNEKKQHPHADLIAQFARDAKKTDRPQDWYERQRTNGDWVSCESLSGDMPTFNERIPHRRKSQWEIDGLKVGDKVRFFDNDIVVIESFEAIPGQYEEFLINEGFSSKTFKYEPSTININGFEVPEPMRNIRVGTEFYYPTYGARVVVANFSIMSDLHRFLSGIGFCHATKAAAEIHAQALYSLKGGIDDDND
jgi:hypothetical protein